MMGKRFRDADAMPPVSAPAWPDARRAAAVIEAHRGLAGAMLPILHALQEEFGYVPREAEPMIAEALNLSRAEVFGVISFYHDFRREPPGRHVLKICRAEACQAMGAVALADGLLPGLGWPGAARRRTAADGRAELLPGPVRLRPGGAV